MDIRVPIVATIAAVALWLVIGAPTTAAQVTDPTTPRPAPAPCAVLDPTPDGNGPGNVVCAPEVAQADTDPAEDEPGWDCRTMGNLVCGHPAMEVHPLCDLATDPDRPAVTPCVMSVTRIFEDTDGTMHTDCAVTLLALGDARLECTDGTGAVTYTEQP